MTWITLIAAVLVVLWFMPGWGIRVFVRRRRTRRHKILAEDALKHCFDAEYTGTTATIHSLAGSLGISANRAAAVTQELVTRGFIDRREQTLVMTESGREYALRVIRAHRLWERYLADETSLQQRLWHSRAERKEHALTIDEMNALAARLGYPRFDPHGDPIPSGWGNVPQRKGTQLSDLKKGSSARVTHIEDEPQAVYDELLKTSLRTGSVLTVTSNERDGMEISSGGDAARLSTSAAQNVTVEPIRGHIPAAPKRRSLADMALGERGVVGEISDTIRGSQRRRLLDLGIIPGTEVTAELRSVSDDPIAYRVRGTLFALRRQLAEHIYIV